MSHFIKSFLSLIVASAIFTNSIAIAGVVGSDPQSAMEVVDEYIQELKDMKASPYEPSSLTLEGQAEYIGRQVAIQIDNLVPNDFNAFLFRMMDRYINHPEERAAIFTFLSIVRSSIAIDLANTQQLKNGPADAAIDGIWNYGFWILLGATIGWSALLKSPARNSVLVKALQGRAAALAKAPRYIRYPSRVILNPLVWSSAAGAAMGLIQFNLENTAAHRVDPIQTLQVVQAQLACKISYDALDLNEAFNGVLATQETIDKNGRSFQKQIKTVLDQAVMLQDQYSALNKLDIEDPAFQQALNDFPKSESWDQFYSALQDAEKSQDGHCRQMSMTAVQIELQTMSDAIDMLITPEPTPTSKATPVTPFGGLNGESIRMN